MTFIHILVEGIDPKPQPRPRAFAFKRGTKVMVRAYDPDTAEHWKNAIAIAAKPNVPFPPLLGPLRVDITFFFDRPKSHFNSKGILKPAAPHWHAQRPDRDNCEKAVLDALSTIGMWKDDCQVCAGEICKRWADGLNTKPGASIFITQLQTNNEINSTEAHKTSSQASIFT